MSVPGEYRGNEQLSDRDYEAIEQAVLESARGRWFLAEHAKRHRAADTLTLLDALKRIETSIAERPVAPVSDVSAIAATRADIAAVRNHLLPDGGVIENTGKMFDTIAARARTAADQLMASVEALQRISGAVRAHAPQIPECEALALEIAKLQTLAWSQDVQSQRIAKAMALLNHLECQTSEPEAALELSAKSLEFFKGDEEIFEGETRNAGAKEADSAEPGASRIIVKQFGRASSPPALQTPELAPAKAPNVTELRSMPAIEPLAQPAAPQEKPRITLIHRAATEEIYIPLASETSGPR
jgi:hypothetical protein